MALIVQQYLGGFYVSSLCCAGDVINIRYYLYGLSLVILVSFRLQQIMTFFIDNQLRINKAKSGILRS
jgi:hypothetical protein